MTWGSFSEFVAMGGYALYVWGSYAATLGLMAAEVVLLIARKRKVLNELGSLTRVQGREIA